VEDKSQTHLKNKEEIKESGEAEAIAYGVAMSQMMDSDTKWKIALNDRKRRYSQSGLTFMSPQKKFRSNVNVDLSYEIYYDSKSDDNNNDNTDNDNADNDNADNDNADNDNADNDNADNNNSDNNNADNNNADNDNADNDNADNDNNNKLQISHEEPYIVLVRVLGCCFTFYRMPHDINLSRRCWGIEDNNATEILCFRRATPLDFRKKSDREIILKFFLSIRDEIQSVSRKDDLSSL